MIPNRLLQYAKRALGDFVFLKLTDLGFVEFGSGDVDVLTVKFRLY